MPDQGGGLKEDLSKIPSWVWLGGAAAAGFIWLLRRGSASTTTASDLSAAPSGLPAASGPVPYTDASGNTWYPPGWIPGSSLAPGTVPTPPTVTPPTTPIQPAPPTTKVPPLRYPEDPGPGGIYPPTATLGPVPPSPVLPPPSSPTLPPTPLTVTGGQVVALPGPSGTPAGQPGNPYNGPVGTAVGPGGVVMVLGPSGWVPMPPPDTSAGGNSLGGGLEAHNAALSQVPANPAAIGAAQQSRAALVTQALNGQGGPGAPPGARPPQQVA